MRTLPPLNSLRAFEAAARLGSFVVAGEELGVSSAAISLQVKSLEENLGKKLFLRQGNKILLTDAGAGILPRLSTAFDDISDAAQVLQRAKHARQLVVSVLPSFAELWLMPRLATFSLGQNVTIDFRVQNDPVDFAREGIDVRLTYGSAYYPGFRERELFTDVVTPVCSPDFWSAHSDLEGILTNVPTKRLIHINWGPTYTSHPKWSDWFKKVGRTLAENDVPQFVISDLSAAIAAAKGGAGVVLAPVKLVERDIANGTLIAPSQMSLKMAMSYVCISPNARSDYALLNRFLKQLTATPT